MMTRRSFFIKITAFAILSVFFCPCAEDLKTTPGGEWAYRGYIEGNYPKALRAYRTGLLEALEMDDLVMQGRYLNNIGAVFSDAGKYDSAYSYFMEAESLFQKAGFLEGAAAVYLSCSNIKLAAGDLSGSEAYLKRTEQFRKSDFWSRRLEAAWFNRKASILLYKEKTGRASENFLKARRLFEKEKDTIGMASAILGLSRAEFKNGDNKAAFKDAEQARELFISSKRPLGIAGCLLHMSEIRISEDDHKAAASILRRLVMVEQGMGVRKRMQTGIMALAEQFREMGMQDSSSYYFGKASELGSP